MNKAQKHVRFTVDVPESQHKYLKMLAANKGISLKQFVLQHLPSLESKNPKSSTIPKDEFEETLKRLLVKHAAVFKRLSKK